MILKYPVPSRSPKNQILWRFGAWNCKKSTLKYSIEKHICPQLLVQDYSTISRSIYMIAETGQARPKRKAGWQLYEHLAGLRWKFAYNGELNCSPHLLCFTVTKTLEWAILYFDYLEKSILFCSVCNSHI